MDEFSNYRYDELAKGFVEIYITENKILAAKMLVEEQIPEDKLPELRSRITKEFLHRGYTFDTEE